MLRQWRQTHKSLEHTPGDIWSLRNPTPLIYCPAFKVTFVRERATATPPSERRFSINRRFWPAFLVIDLFTTYTLLYCTSFAWSILHDRIKIFFVQGHRFVDSLVLVTYEALSVCVCVCIYVVPAVQCILLTMKKISRILCEPCFPRRDRAQWKCRLILFTLQECIPVINLPAILRLDNAFTPLRGLVLRDLGFKHSISLPTLWYLSSKRREKYRFKCVQFCERMEPRMIVIIANPIFLLLSTG